MTIRHLLPGQAPKALPLRTAADVALRLEIGIDTLADLSGIDRRVMRSDPNDPFVRRLVNDIVRVAAVVNRELDNLDLAYAFLARRPILQIEGRTALEAICLGHADQVIEVLGPSLTAK